MRFPGRGYVRVEKKGKWYFGSLMGEASMKVGVTFWW